MTANEQQPPENSDSLEELTSVQLTTVEGCLWLLWQEGAWFLAWFLVFLLYVPKPGWLHVLNGLGALSSIYIVTLLMRAASITCDIY